MKHFQLLIIGIIVLVVVVAAFAVSGQSEATGTITESESTIDNIVSSVSEFTDPTFEDSITVEVKNIVDEEGGYINEESSEYSGVEIEISNNGDEVISYALGRVGLVYDDGTQISELSFFKTLVDNKYRDVNRDRLSLYPGGKKTFNIAFDKIDMSKNPTIVVTLYVPPHQGEDKKREFIIPL